MIKALLFDYFGVVSTDGFWSHADQDLEKSDSGKKSGREDFLKMLAKETDKPPEEVAYIHSAHKLDVKLLHFIAVAKNSYKTALVTNANGQYIRPVVTSAGLDSVFDEIVISSEVGAPKPDPKMYSHALDLLSVLPEEAVMIDDLARNVDGAIDAGLKGIVYENLEQLKTDLSKIGVEL